MTTLITEQEVVNALSGLDNLKSPGIDGYDAYFFKKAWNIVKADLLKVMEDFFVNGRIFKAPNCTLATLIPKIKEAKKIRDCMPISCCSNIYKIISKIMTTRMGKVLTSIVDQNQVAFVP